MQVPAHLAALRRLASAALILATAMAFGARGPRPDFTIPLEQLGFQTLSQQPLLAGSSMLTVHFIDDQHLLVTFELRALLKRIPGDPPDDQDRNIRALLLELPSGRILAHTDWRTHDRGQYLWSLGHGRFLLRIRDTLTTIAPLVNFSTSDPFRQRPFLDVPSRRIGMLLLTPNADVLTVETKSLKPAASGSQPPQFVPAADSDPHSDPIQINFYRIAIPEGHGDEVLVRAAGAGRSQAFGSLALTAAGHLELIDQGHQHWAFNSDTFSGETKELAPFDSTCRPSPTFVSPGEFIAFGCHGGQTPQVLGGFNMRGEEMWEQGLFGDYTAPYLVFAPDGGRFALGRIMSAAPFTENEPLIPGVFNGQSVVVYQTDSGKQILKLDCSPIEPAGQNFALSPDGLSFGVVRDGAIEIYKLPPLNKKEQAAVKLAQSVAPAATELPIRFTAEAASSAPDEAMPPAANQPSPQPAAAQTKASTRAPASVSTSAAAPQPAAQPATAPSGNASGDQQEQRKPPTLDTLPTDPQQEQHK